MGLFARLAKVFQTEPPVTRKDSWENPTTGSGTARDKVMAGAFYPGYLLTDVELDALYYHNALAAKKVDKLVDATFRAGFKLEGDNEENALEKWCKSKAVPILKHADKLARCYGGSAIWVGTGEDPKTPLNELRIPNFFMVIDRRHLAVHEYYSDAKSPKFGQPMTYQMSDPLGGFSVIIHETRLLRFDGIEVDRRTRHLLKGWSYSVLQRPYDELRAAGQSFQALDNLLVDASQAVYKIKDLHMKLATDKENIHTRLQLLDAQRFSGKGIAIDADSEDFERKQTPFSGLADLSDRVMIRVAAAFDMPVSELFGDQPSGLQATGEADQASWHNSIREHAEYLQNHVTIMARLGAMLLGMNPDDVEVTWNNPAQPTAKEQADQEKIQAERDKIYLDSGVWLPEEVAIARVGSGGVEIDVDARKAALELSLEALTNPPEPEMDPNAQATKPVPKKSGSGQAPKPTK